MKRLLLIENERDYLSAKDFLGREGSLGAENIVINLNSNHIFSFEDQPGICYQTESDYLPFISQEQINHQAIQDTRTWLKDSDAFRSFYYKGIDLTLVYEHNLARAVTTLYKYLELLKLIIAQLKPDEILMVSDHRANSVENLRIIGDEKILNPLVRMVCEHFHSSENIRLTFIENTSPKKFQRKKNGTKGKWRGIRTIFRGLRYGMNFVLKQLPHKGVPIFVMGAPRLMFPIISEINKKDRYHIHYFQPGTSPRIMAWLFRHRIPYLSQEDFQSKPKKINQDLESFCDHMKQKGLFEYQGMSLISILKQKFKYVLEYLLPQAQYDVNRFRELFLKNHFSLIMVDEDISYANRIILLTAKNLGVRTVEYQHGVMRNYFVQLKLTDKKLVWGNYFKDRIMQEMEVSNEDIWVTGPVHLGLLKDKLRQGHGSSDQRFLKSRYKIGAGQRIVLYTPHSFRKGSRGGLLNRHNTRDEVEEMLHELVRALSNRKDLYLIIKLHHGDANTTFYQEFMCRFGKEIPYSIEKTLSILTLLNGCDLLATPISTTILEGLMLSRPIILLNPKRKNIIFPYVEWGAVATAEQPGDLKSQIDLILVDPDSFVARYKTGRNRIVNEFTANENHIDLCDTMDRWLKDQPAQQELVGV